MGAHRCNLVIPGFPKCGTSSFHEYLRRHKNICMSTPKEPHYFARSDRWARGVASHNEIFEHCQDHCRYYGESSTIYCIWPPAISRIQSCLDQPKIIFLLRDPVERLISHFMWVWRLGYETRPILKALDEDGEGFHPDKWVGGSYMAYREFSRYSKYVPLWVTAFGVENVLLVATEKLRKNPLETLNGCFDFLGVERLCTISTVAKNVTGDIGPVVRPAWTSHVRRLLPSGFREVLRRSSLIKRAWERISVRPAMVQPVIGAAELDEIRDMLKYECAYFDTIFQYAGHAAPS